MRVYLGLGSNLGNRRDNLRSALRELVFGPARLKQFRISSVYESAALVPEGSPKSWNLPFYNMAIYGQSDLNPQDLFAECKRIEHKGGRKKREKWSPRLIDLDILGVDKRFEEFWVQDQQVHIPHREVLNRSFTLAPLAEIAPNWRPPIPGVNQTIGEIFETKRPTLSPIQTKSFSILPIGLMGIVNVTPDSFSDGDEAFKPNDALSKISQLIYDGADIVDVGAESTRPGAITLTSEAEWERLEPILTQFQDHAEIRLSVDSRKPEVILNAVNCGLDWINDVTGLDDDRMIRLAIESNKDVVFMHHLGVPPSKTHCIPSGSDPIFVLKNWAAEKISHFNQRGLSKDKLVFDPGIGFGKTPEQSLEIIERVAELKELDVRILIGHSRKSFLSLFTNHPFSERDIETLSLSSHLMKHGVDYIRVHNVTLHQRFLKTAGLDF